MKYASKQAFNEKKKRIGEQRANQRRRVRSIQSEVEEEELNDIVADDTLTSMPHNINPSTSHDPMYLDYCKILHSIDEGTPGYRFLGGIPNNCRPSIVSSLDNLKSMQLPMDLWRRIRDGVVGECTLLSFVIISQSNRHTKYQQSTDCASVEVDFGT